MTRRKVWLIVTVAMLGFACAPSLSLAPVPTLDPLSMNTAIALTAGAASAQTAAVAQGSQPTSPVLFVLDGPTLDPLALNTAIAQTAAAAAVQTQALIPNTLTPSVTPLPSKTPTITPSVTNTFVFIFVPTVTRFPASPTPTSSSQKKKNGGGEGGDPQSPYTCKVMGVTPENGSNLGPNTVFDVAWHVKNKGQNWPKNKVYVSYVGGTLIPLTEGNKLGPLSPYDISGGDFVGIKGISLRTPAVAGKYSTTWVVTVEDIPACALTLTVVVQASLTEAPLERMDP